MKADCHLSQADNGEAVFKTEKGQIVIPHRVESFLVSLPYIAQAAVLGEGRTQPLAIIVIDSTAIDQTTINSDAINDTDTGDNTVAINDEKSCRNEAIHARLVDDLSDINGQLKPYCRPNCVVVTTIAMSLKNNLLKSDLSLNRIAIEQHFAHFLDEDCQGIIWQ